MMVEGHGRVFPKVLASAVCDSGLCPSTSFAGPPPRAEEDHHTAPSAANSRSRCLAICSCMIWLVPS